MNKEIDKFVDLLFNFDIKELENETKFLENYKKIQQENQELKKMVELYSKSLYYAELIKLKQENQKYKEVIDKAREYVEKHLTDNGRFLMLNEWQVPDLLEILKEVK